MTASDPQAGEVDKTTKETVTRRSCLSAFATGAFMTTSNTTAATSPATQPDEFLITQAQLPKPFTERSGTSVDDAFNSVQSPEGCSTRQSQVSLNSFWAGDDPDEPLWVAGSSAYCSIDRGNVATVAERVSQEYAEFINAYDAETHSSWHFDTQYTESETFREWRTGIYIGHQTSTEELVKMADEPKLVDVFRMQYVNNTLLGTILFGPTDWYWSYTELLDRLTQYQRDQVVSFTESGTADGLGVE